MSRPDLEYRTDGSEFGTVRASSISPETRIPPAAGREPGGVPFEFAIEAPGFDRDEPVAELGSESYCRLYFVEDPRAISG